MTANDVRKMRDAGHGDLVPGGERRCFRCTCSGGSGSEKSAIPQAINDVDRRFDAILADGGRSFGTATSFAASSRLTTMLGSTW